MTDWRNEYLHATHDAFTLQRSLCEKAVAQLDEADLFRTVSSDDNSIAVLMKHVGGNLRSRWTEPFTTDGEKPDRHRDAEFVTDADTAASVRAVWDGGWDALDAVLAAARPVDLDRTLMIRGEPNTLIKALQRSLAHTAQHAGQIILLAKQWKGAAWRTLSIPRGESEKYRLHPPTS